MHNSIVWVICSRFDAKSSVGEAIQTIHFPGGFKGVELFSFVGTLTSLWWKNTLEFMLLDNVSARQVVLSLIEPRPAVLQILQGRAIWSVDVCLWARVLLSSARMILPEAWYDAKYLKFQIETQERMESCAFFQRLYGANNPSRNETLIKTDNVHTYNTFWAELQHLTSPLI